MRRSAAVLVRPVLWAVVVSLAACGHRSVATAKGEVAIESSVRRIRVEIENGTLGFRPPEDAKAAPVVDYQGGVRKMAESEEQLRTLDALSPELTSELVDGGETLVLRGPSLPEGVSGMIAFEAGIRLPATMPLEVIVKRNGHVTMADRAAPTLVETGRGDLRFENCAGGIEAKTGGGVVIAFGIRGDLDIRTLRGDMQAFFVQAGDEITLETGQGTIQCRVPPETGFDLDARVEIGKIGPGFGLEPRRIGDYSAAMTGRHGDGRTKVVLRSASGHISFAEHEQR